MSVNSLRSHTTMKIGGDAERLLLLKDLEILKTEASELPAPIRILGNGSNTLIDDRGLSGTVIVVRDFPPLEPKILEETSSKVVIECSSGIYLPFLCKWASKKALSGCEYMVGVPGTIGGA